MGYAQLKQRGHGIHTRQFARSFIVEESPDNRVVFVSVDAGMISHAVKRNVIRELQKKFGDRYTMENVMISGTRKLSNVKLNIFFNNFLNFIKIHTALQPASTCLCCMT